MANRPIDSFLDQLSSAAAENAWNEFLEEYGSLILYVVRQHERDDDRVNDCFLYVCEKLSLDRFRRLRRFQPDGPAQFPTWLSVVVSNLSIDWRRKEFGRLRPFRAITKLPALDQLVFRSTFEGRMTFQECWHALQPQFPDLTEERLSDVVAHLHSVLTPRQHWLLSIRRRELRSFSEPTSSGENRASREPEDPGPGPETLTQLEQERTTLLRAMSQLTSFQRVLLRLRYQDDLTLKEVARLTGLGDPFRAKRQIQAALDALAGQLTAEDSASLRKTEGTVRVQGSRRKKPSEDEATEAD